MLKKYKLIKIPLTLIILNVILNIVKYKYKIIQNLFEEGDKLAVEIVPEWLANLEDEDLNFIKRFIISSGSLKEIANIYGVTYPTVRLKLDRVIQKIQLSDDTQNEPYISLIKRLAVNEKIDFDTAKVLISEYRKIKEP